jgi:hypothetical protein
MKKDLTIEEIENLEGLIFDDSDKDLNYSLPLWHKGIRQKRLSELTDGDLARLIRQDMYIKYIISECLQRLNVDPIIGDKYNGELLTALVKDIGDEFWKEHQDFKILTQKFINKFYENIDKFIYGNEILDEFEKGEITELINQLEKKLNK